MAILFLNIEKDIQKKINEDEQQEVLLLAPTFLPSYPERIVSGIEDKRSFIFINYIKE